EPRSGAGAAPQTGSGVLRRRSAPVVEEGGGRDLAARVQRLSSMEEIVVSDVLLRTDHGRITVSNLPDRPGNCSRIFQAVAAGGIVVDMIIQNLTSAGRAELSFSVPQGDLDRALLVPEK